MTTIRYIIADDHAIFRQGIKFSLSEDENLQCIGEAGDGDELIKILHNGLPDVILMDLKMPGTDGVAATKEIKRLYPAIKIIALTMYDDEQYIIHMLDIGANGYLIKNTEPSEIINAIHTVFLHDYYFSDMVSKTMLKTIVNKKKITPRFDNAIQLNEREADILKLICKEYTTAEIAEQLYLSQRTVEGLRAGMLEKVGVRNTAGLVLFAAKHGFAD